MKRIIYISIYFLLLTTFGCKDPYYINVDNNDLNVLIVEGQITGDNTMSYVNLSRSVNVNEASQVVPEQGAAVFVQDRNSNNTPLYYSAVNGRYEAVVDTEVGQEYRMLIRTQDGKEYASAYVKLLNTPDINNVTFERVYEGLALYISTEDPTNNTRYYHWNFDEDWEINSAYSSSVWYDPVNILVKDSSVPTQFRCFKRDESRTILLGTTDNMTTSKIEKQRILLVPDRDDRFSVRYSILVRQYALSLEGYKFLDLMRKNTESLGSIFDPQPSELVGNVVCISDPEQKVLGFVDASIEKTKRIFIAPSQVESWNFRMNCELYTVPNHPDSLKFFYPNLYLPFDVDMAGFISATSSCVDCRLRGGDNNKPVFW